MSTDVKIPQAQADAQHVAPKGVKLPIYMDNHATTPMDPRVRFVEAVPASLPFIEGLVPAGTMYTPCTSSRPWKRDAKSRMVRTCRCRRRHRLRRYRRTDRR